MISFIVGPTATGKSDYAYHLAETEKAEIISCDSMLVYREPKIITAKPPVDYLSGIPHHFIDIISVTDEYNVYDYSRKAVSLISDLVKRDKPVVVCGGTGLYFKAILDGILTGPGKNEALRLELEQKAADNGTDALYKELVSRDPQAAAKIASADKRRIIRALEVCLSGEDKFSQKKLTAKGIWGKFPIEIKAFNYPRDQLYRRIDQRVEVMFAKGAVEEVKYLNRFSLSITAEKIIGIKEINAYLNGKLSLSDAKELMKKNTRNYAKRQLTWFRNDKRIEWIDA